MPAVQTWGTSWGTSWLTYWDAIPGVDPLLAARTSRLYTNFITEFNNSTIDLVSDSIKIIPVDENYVFSAEHIYLSELGTDALEPAVSLTGNKFMTGTDTFRYGTRKAKFISVTGSVNAFVLYVDTGNAATSQLISYHNEDFNNITKEMTGGDLEWVFNTGGFFEVSPEDVYVGRVFSFTFLIGSSNIPNFRS
jgi:hypothetical protein